MVAQPCYLTVVSLVPHHPPFQCTHLCVHLSVHACGCVCVLDRIFLGVYIDSVEYSISGFSLGGDQVWFNDWWMGMRKGDLKYWPLLKHRSRKQIFLKKFPFEKSIIAC